MTPRFMTWAITLVAMLYTDIGTIEGTKVLRRWCAQLRRILVYVFSIHKWKLYIGLTHELGLSWGYRFKGRPADCRL